MKNLITLQRAQEIALTWEHKDFPDSEVTDFAKTGHIDRHTVLETVRLFDCTDDKARVKELHKLLNYLLENCRKLAFYL